MNDIYAKAPLCVTNKAIAEKENMKYIPIAGDIVLASTVCVPKWDMIERNANHHPLSKNGLGKILSDLRGDKSFLPDNTGVLVITTEDTNCGAIALFYKGVLEALKNYWLVPSSVHEWLAFPKSVIDKENLTKMIREINEAEVRPHERLSDRPYVAVYRGKWTIEEA